MCGCARRRRPSRAASARHKLRSSRVYGRRPSACRSGRSARRSRTCAGASPWFWLATGSCSPSEHGAGSDKHRTSLTGRQLLEAAFFGGSRCARAMKRSVVSFHAFACGNVLMQCVGDASGCMQRLRLRRVRFDVPLTCFCFQWKPQWKPRKLSDIERCLCL